jgi:subtilisin
MTEADDAQSGVAADLPAWSECFRPEIRASLRRARPFQSLADRTWLQSTGAGMVIAIVDSGVEGDHPAIGGKLVRSVRVELDGDDAQVVDDDPVDVVGHGTACAGIIHELVPEADLISVRVLGQNNKAKGLAFAHGLDWVIQQRIPVANLSLSSRSDDLFAIFHDLVDQAYFANTSLVCAASNHPGQSSYPSLFSSVISVAAHDVPDHLAWFYNPRPPVEFGAWGVDVPVPWRGGSSIIGTGNSFATPHIAGLVARIRATYPTATPFEVKSLLAAGAADPAAR